jgi:hypothetical protein
MRYGVVMMPSGIICSDTELRNVLHYPAISTPDIEWAIARAKLWNTAARVSIRYSVFEWTREVCRGYKKTNGGFRYIGKTFQ